MIISISATCIDNVLVLEWKNAGLRFIFWDNFASFCAANRLPVRKSAFLWFARVFGTTARIFDGDFFLATRTWSNCIGRAILQRFWNATFDYATSDFHVRYDLTFTALGHRLAPAP